MSRENRIQSDVDRILAKLIEAEQHRAGIAYWLSQGATSERISNGDARQSIDHATAEVVRYRFELDAALCSQAIGEKYRPMPTTAAIVETMCRRLRNNDSLRQVEERQAPRGIPTGYANTVSPAGAA